MKHRITALLLAVLLVFNTIIPINASETIVSGHLDQRTVNRAIVIIPGMLGSKLSSPSGTVYWPSVSNKAYLALTETGTSVYSVKSYNDDDSGTMAIYYQLHHDLYQAFHNSFDILFFDYDWRLSNAAAATKLATFVSNYDEIVLVAHSMGGLVASKFLANSAANRNKTAALITLGTPFAGAAKCLNVMETGEMLEFGLFGFTVAVFKSFIKGLAINSYAAYQLLPTSTYYSITGEYPIKIGGTNYTNAMTYVPNMSWAKKSNNATKPMVSGATSFHSSLVTSGTHVIDRNDVTVYTIGSSGTNTISSIWYDSSYQITNLLYTNAGDGTVLRKSAGYGTPDYTSSATHPGLVSDSTVINKVINRITAYTGIPSALAFTSSVNEMQIKEAPIVINERGWVMGFDNKRINVIAEKESILDSDLEPVIIIGDEVYNSKERFLGNAWELGDSGKVFYALNDGNYSLRNCKEVSVEYMDDGYYLAKVDYKQDQKITLTILSHKEKAVEGIDSKGASMVPSYVYSEEELAVFNAL